jgi:hypothetical protein
MSSALQWSTTITIVREHIEVQQPTQGELAELALVLLEEVWAAVKAGHVPQHPGDCAPVGAYPESIISSFKHVLDAAHDMRLATRTFASV